MAKRSAIKAGAECCTLVVPSTQMARSLVYFPALTTHTDQTTLDIIRKSAVMMTAISAHQPQWWRVWRLPGPA